MATAQEIVQVPVVILLIRVVDHLVDYFRVAYFVAVVVAEVAENTVPNIAHTTVPEVVIVPVAIAVA